MMNETFNDLDSVIQLSKDSDTLGYDLRAGKTWIYPTNYPVREYQYNITQAALHHNTLVSLPTGLGKTFIAAVIMFNFYRWYPMGKIIFMAPTKPLVTQQMDACYNIMAIPKNTTVEMTGSKVSTSRVQIWKEKRVFFITPHILQNDIDTVLELAPQIRCIVIDEAHKALGKNANCEVIKKIQKLNHNFRVLALSATPGSNFNSIKDVITNLLISHIEVRSNESIDVAPYVFQRKLETCVIPISGKLLSIKMEYIKLLDRFTRPLLQYNIFTGNCANLTKGRIFLTMKEFKEKGRHHNQYGYILKTLNICVSLYHGYELLIRHGLRAFLLFFQENVSKPLINSIGEVHSLIEDIQNYLGPIKDIEVLPDGTIPEIQGNLVYSHPKFEKLSTVLQAHFNEGKDTGTKVMVFCEYRESVLEIYELLLRHRPLIKPRIFLGQGAISQAQQLQAVKMFKSGQCNTLVSTCIGEEGLDVGEVDLIVCFDINSKSPIRMVQRMGRTGRKRDGRVVVLVTEGKEQQLLSECLVQRNNMNSLLESQPIKTHLYNSNPKMIPKDINPECNKMFITVQETESPAKKKIERKTSKKNNVTNKNTVKNMFENMSSSESSTRSSNDGKNTTSTNKTSSKKSTSPSKKQADIRSMFSKINNIQMNSKQVIQDDDEYIDNDNDELKELISSINSYLNISVAGTTCIICDNLFDCKTICSSTNAQQKFQWNKSNISFDKITAESLNIFAETLAPLNTEISFELFNENNIDLDETLEFFKLKSTSDIFADDTESDTYDDFADDAILFNNSMGIFNSSRIYNTQNLIPTQIKSQRAESPTDMFNISNSFDFEIENRNIEMEPPKIKNVKSTIEKTPIKDGNILDESIVISDSDTELSPVLITTRKHNEFRNSIQRKLFSQINATSTSNSAVTKDFKSLENSNIINKIPDKNKFTFVSMKNSDKIEPKFVSTPKVNNNIQSNFTSPQNAQNNNFNNEQSKTIESPVNESSKLEENVHFWDESLFEICDSDEEFNKVEEKDKNDSVEIISVQKLSPKSSNYSKTENNCKENQKSKTNDEVNLNDSIDSDETIMLSFNTDDIFQDLEQEKLKSGQPDDDKVPVQITLNNRIPSVSNDKTVIDTSLLSITQLIDYLNDSKSKTQTDKSVKLNSPGGNKKLSNTVQLKSNQSKCDLFSDKDTESPIKNDSMDDSANAILDNLLSFDISFNKSYEKNNKTEGLDLSMLDDVNFEDSDEELNLCFSQNIKISQTTSKTNEKHSKENFITNKSRLKSAETSALNILKSQTNSRLNEQSITETIKINDRNEPNRNKYQNKNDKSLAGSSQNIYTNRNKKIKLQLTSTTNPSNESKHITNNSKNSADLNVTLSQYSPLKIKRNSGLSKKRVVLSDSDDDFEVKPKRKQPAAIIYEPEKKLKRNKSIPETPKLSLSTKTVSEIRKSRTQSYPTTKTKSITTSKAQKILNCEFISYEADVSIDEHYEPDSEEDSDDVLESSFVHDTESILDETDMQAKYLQSIRSPKKFNPFKMPPLPTNVNVFSQVENNDDNMYMMDSFCIDNDVTLSQRNGLSYLEMIEAQLEKKVSKDKKRKRIIEVSDDSD